mmetsp:Transcript_5243/g.7872  ORF Transcript_5243/g.7872 Transcript_5243/m.7872 type:complete len:229 (-) Transcript_5243:1588-2274(-)
MPLWASIPSTSFLFSSCFKSDFFCFFSFSEFCCEEELSFFNFISRVFLAFSKSSKTLPLGIADKLLSPLASFKTESSLFLVILGELLLGTRALWDCSNCSMRELGSPRFPSTTWIPWSCLPVAYLTWWFTCSKMSWSLLFNSEFPSLMSFSEMLKLRFLRYSKSFCSWSSSLVMLLLIVLGDMCVHISLNPNSTNFSRNSCMAFMPLNLAAISIRGISAAPEKQKSFR